MARKVVKSRCWSIIGWVESLPDDWLKRLNDSYLPVVVSPLHDMDIDDDTGELKKPHYHIIVCWDGPITLQNAQQFADEMGLGSYVERVRSTKNILDYLTHDSYSSQGKYRYDVKDIKWIHSCYDDFVKISFRLIVQYIRDHKIKQFSKLIDALFDDNENDLLEFVSNHTYYVNIYIRSLKENIDADISQAYNLLKGIADECDARGKFTLDRAQYDKLFEVFEQLEIWAEEI